MAKLIYPQLSYKLTGLLYKVHNKLDRFFKERQYYGPFEKLLIKNKINYQREKDFSAKF